MPAADPLLLDTHTLLWYYLTNPSLSASARSAIEDPSNIILVSAASRQDGQDSTGQVQPNVEQEGQEAVDLR